MLRVAGQQAGVAQFDVNAGAQGCTDPSLERLMLEPYANELEAEYMQTFVGSLTSKHWVADEVDFSKDKVSELTPAQLHMVKYPHLFFALSEKIVKDSLLTTLRERLTWMPVHAFIDHQMANEREHERTYNRAFNSLFPPSERAKAMEQLENSPSIQAKRKWMEEGCGDDVSTVELLLRAACSEGIFFCASFATIHGIRKLGLLPGICDANDFISRDEMLHARNWLFILKNLCDPLDRDLVERVVGSAVEIEDTFINEVFTVIDIKVGITRRRMKQYVRFIADELLGHMGQAPMYNAKNPFDWMKALTMNVKESFHERTTKSYSTFDIDISASEIAGFLQAAGLKPPELPPAALERLCDA